MKSTAQFYISKGQESYVASGVDLPVLTQADTLDELMVNLREAVSLYFEDEDVASLGFDREPAIVINYELVESVHA